MNNQENPQISPLSKLKQQLQNSGIDPSEWGVGQAKTLEHLLKEIESEETSLEIDSTGKFLRKLIVGNANIYYTSPDGKKYHLKEEKQIFKDGRERRRNLDQSLAEKIKSTEDPKDATARGIQEELGIESEITLTENDTKKELVVSPSYPGLQSEYILHKFEAILNDEQFKPEGYIEKQSDKSTYFVWEEIK